MTSQLCGMASPELSSNQTASLSHWPRHALSLTLTHRESPVAHTDMCGLRLPAQGGKSFDTKFNAIIYTTHNAEGRQTHRRSHSEDEWTLRTASSSVISEQDPAEDHPPTDTIRSKQFAYPARLVMTLPTAPIANSSSKHPFSSQYYIWNRNGGLLDLAAK